MNGGDPTGHPPGALAAGDGSGLPLDPALVEGRQPDRPAEEIPELHQTGCPDDLREGIEELMSRYPDRHSASIPTLWAVQRRYGWCTPEGIRQAAAVMRVTPAYLEAVASFYDLLHTEPVGRHRVLVCTNISCWMRGGDELLEAFCDAAGCDPAAAGHGGSSSEDRELFVTGFECLGACDLAPMASIDGRYFGPLTGGDATEAVQQLRSGAEVLPDRALAKRGAAGGPEPDPDPRVAAGEQASSDERQARSDEGSRA
jgi:NADH-quinone oxidoreductase subunit E